MRSAVAATREAMAERIKVLSAGAVKPALVKVIDAFRCQTGCDAMVAFATAPEIRKRLSSGESADIVIAPPNLLDDLCENGKIDAVGHAVIGRIGVGVLVRSGAPLPKIATVDEFKQSLLNASSVVYNQASTGTYIESLFERLEIRERLKDKTTRYPDFAAVRDHISKGTDSEIGLGATTVIIESTSKGVTFVGPLPAEIQNYTAYAAAVVELSSAKETARELVHYLASPAAKNLFKESGIE
jgi:molybdate transport system substrate-binding protein